MAQVTSQVQQTIPLGGNAVTFDCPDGLSLKSIETPSSMNGDNLRFKTSSMSPASSGTPKDLYNAATRYSVTVAANRTCVIPNPEFFIGVRRMTIENFVSTTLTNVTGADLVLLLNFSTE